MNRKALAALLSLPLISGGVWYYLNHGSSGTSTADSPAVAATQGKKAKPSDPADAPIRLPVAKPVIKPGLRPVSSPGPVPASITEAMNAPVVREWADRVNLEISTGNLAGAAELLRQAKKTLPAAERALVVRRVAKALAETAKANPKKAPALLKELKDLQLQQDLANGLTLELAEKKDFSTAAEFVTEVADTTEGQPAAETLGREWAADDRTAAIDWINSLESRLLQARASGGMAFDWAQEDMDGLVEWANKIPDSAVQGQVLLKAVKLMAQDDPAAAAKWAATFPPGTSRVQAVGFTAGQWASAEPQLAAQWAQSLPDAQDSGVATISVAETWAEADAAAALAWANALPETLRAGTVNAITGTGPAPVSGEVTSPGTAPGAAFTGAPRQNLEETAPAQPAPAPAAQQSP